MNGTDPARSQGIEAPFKVVSAFRSDHDDLAVGLLDVASDQLLAIFDRPLAERLRDDLDAFLATNPPT